MSYAGVKRTLSTRRTNPIKHTHARPLAAPATALSAATGSPSFPMYAVSRHKCFEFAITGIMPNQFEYRALPIERYPDLILQLRIRSLTPRNRACRSRNV